MDAEMHFQSVLEKTPKGREELNSRSHGLTPAVRALLILADGRRTVGELLEAGRDRSRSEQELIALLRNGYVRAAGRSGGPATGNNRSTDSSGEDLRPRVRALIAEMFGSQPKLLQKLDAARNTDDSLDEAIQSCARYLKLFVDVERSEIFLKRADAMLADLRKP